MQHFRNLYRQAEFGDRYLYKAGDKIVVNGTTYMVMSYPRLEMDWRELRSLIVQKACEHRLECGVCKDLLWPEHISFLDHIRGRLQSSVPLYVDDLFKDIVVLAKKDGEIFDAWFFKRYVRIFHRTCIEKNGGVKVFQKSGSRYSFDMLDRLFLLDDCCPLDGPVIEKRTFRLHQIRRHKMPYGLRWSHPKYVHRQHLLTKMKRRKKKKVKKKVEPVRNQSGRPVPFLDGINKLRLASEVKKKKRRHDVVSPRDAWIASCIRNTLIDAWIHPSVVYDKSQVDWNLIKNVSSMRLNNFLRVLYCFYC